MSQLMRRNLSLFKLISFDATGTLVSLRHSPGTLYEQVAREDFGYTGLDIKSLDKGFKRNFKALSTEYPNYGKAHDLHWRSWWSLLVQRTFKDVAVVIDPGHFEAIVDKLIKMFETEDCWTRTTDQAVDFVRQIKDMGLHTCVITNSDPRTEKILRNLGYPDFDFVLSAYDTGVEKPDSRIFELASNRCRGTVISPWEAMHIGNDFKLDYCAAYKCKWTGVLIRPDLPHEDPEKFKFKSLSSFIDYLKREKITRSL